VEATERKKVSNLRLLQSKAWKLVSIYETGLVPDMARYKDGEVEIIFGKLNLYAVYGNKSEVFPYKFIAPDIFKVMINGDEAVCRIKEITPKKVVFYADLNNSHFILELKRD
jgi:hypothetical protein